VKTAVCENGCCVELKIDDRDRGKVAEFAKVCETAKISHCLAGGIPGTNSGYLIVTVGNDRDHLADCATDLLFTIAKLARGEGTKPS